MRVDSWLRGMTMGWGPAQPYALATALAIALALAWPRAGSAQERQTLAPAALTAAPAPAEVLRLRIAPSLTDARLAADEAPHLVAYAPAAAPAATAAPLLVWLGGTGGRPESGPHQLYATALQQGYRLLALSYINTPAVAQVCTGALLRTQRDCAGLVRQQRVWGDANPALLADRPEDAIVPRLTQLLLHLARSDPAGDWHQYLDGGAPRWARLVLAGQSQGGGMAAYIAQTQVLAGVLIFSGGWDRQASGDLARWYGRPSATPALRWHASFHVDEAQADSLARSYQRLGVPAAQIHALDLPVHGRSAHGEGIANPAYKPLWEQMLALPR